MAGPSKPKEELVSDDEEKDELESEEEEDIPDPHQDPSSRKREMDKDMDESEKKGLRGGWEEFFPSLGKISPTKRAVSPDSDDDPGPQPKRPAPKQTPRFGKAMVEAERKKDLGLVSDGRREKQTLGGESLDGEGDLVISADGRSGWSCQLCTFANLMDHGRCGELERPSA